MPESLGGPFVVFLLQVGLLAGFGLARARFHPGAGIWRGKLPKFNGFIEPFVCRALIAGSSISSGLMGSRLSTQILGDRDAVYRQRNGLWVDAFIVLCLALSVLSYGAIILIPGGHSGWLLVFPIWRLIDLLSANLRINLFDHLIAKRAPSAASATRMLILVFFNFVEISICFACFYAASGLLRVHGGDVVDWVDPIHFSCVTQLTIGYGDATPEGYLRLVADTQGMIGLVVLVLFIGRFVSSLPAIRSLHTHESEGTSKGENGD
jgi:hypothetical protein